MEHCSCTKNGIIYRPKKTGHQKHMKHDQEIFIATIFSKC